jgi:hypothetical protein
MKVVQLNENELPGRATRTAYRLHKGLQPVGHKSAMVVDFRTSDDPSVVAFEKSKEAWISYDEACVPDVDSPGLQAISPNRSRAARGCSVAI